METIENGDRNIDSIDLVVRARLTVSPQSRPFICDGLPVSDSVFLIGYNPATTMDQSWISFWSTTHGYDYSLWEKMYIHDRTSNGKTEKSSTRTRIDRIRQETGCSIFETNIFDFPTKTIGDLKRRENSIVQNFVHILHPRCIVIYGKNAQYEFQKLFPPGNQHGDNQVLFSRHFSRISNAQLQQVIDFIRKTIKAS